VRERVPEPVRVDVAVRDPAGAATATKHDLDAVRLQWSATPFGEPEGVSLGGPLVPCGRASSGTAPAMSSH
jgi:hypothetical protein